MLMDDKEQPDTPNADAAERFLREKRPIRGGSNAVDEESRLTAEVISLYNFADQIHSFFRTSGIDKFDRGLLKVKYKLENDSYPEDLGLHILDLDTEDGEQVSTDFSVSFEGKRINYIALDSGLTSPDSYNLVFFSNEYVTDAGEEVQLYHKFAFNREGEYSMYRAVIRVDNSEFDGDELEHSITPRADFSSLRTIGVALTMIRRRLEYVANEELPKPNSDTPEITN